MDTSRTNHRSQRNASARKQDALRSNPARHGIVEPEPLANSDSAFVTQVIVFAPELPVHAVPDDSRFGTVVVCPGKPSAPQQPVKSCDGCGSGCIGGGSGNRIGSGDGDCGEYSWVFDSLGPDDAETINDLRVFYEIGVEFQNGAKSFRQISARIGGRSLDNRFPIDLPWSPSTITRCRKEVVKFFDEQLGLDGDPLFKLSGKGGAMAGLTEKGWRLWEATTAYLIRRGFIPENYLTDCA